MRLRPVLMPGGWPIEASEREMCARAVLASGGDLERVYDESELGVEAYIRHISRVTLFRLDREHALVFMTGSIDSVVSALAFYTRLFEQTNQFDKASWFAFLPQHRIDEFLSDAKAWGDIDTWGDGICVWYTSPRPVLVISGTSEFTRLRQAITDVSHTPASGVVAITEPIGSVSQPAARDSDLPTCKAPIHVSFNSLAQLRSQSQFADFDQPVPQRHSPPPRITMPPPSNPRIRRSTG